MLIQIKHEIHHGAVKRDAQGNSVTTADHEGRQVPVTEIKRFPVGVYDTDNPASGLDGETVQHLFDHNGPDVIAEYKPIQTNTTVTIVEDGKDKKTYGQQLRETMEQGEQTRRSRQATNRAEVEQQKQQRQQPTKVSAAPAPPALK